MYTTKDFYEMAEEIHVNGDLPKFHEEDFVELMHMMLNKLGDDSKKTRRKRVLKVLKAFNRPGSVKDLKKYVDADNIAALFKNENAELLVRDIHEYLELFDKNLDIVAFTKNIR